MSRMSSTYKIIVHHVKACFPILKRMTPYSFMTQTKIVMACFSIHNFLRQISVADRLFFEYDNEVELESDNANQEFMQ